MSLARSRMASTRLTRPQSQARQLSRRDLLVQETGKQIPNKNDPGTSIDETKQVIPDEYNRDSKTKAEIKSGSNTQNFELKSGGKITQGGAAGTGNHRPANDETQPNRR